MTKIDRYRIRDFVDYAEYHFGLQLKKCFAKKSLKGTKDFQVYPLKMIQDCRSANISVELKNIQCLYGFSSVLRR